MKHKKKNTRSIYVNQVKIVGLKYLIPINLNGIDIIQLKHILKPILLLLMQFMVKESQHQTTCTSHRLLCLNSLSV